jgi:two-component system sensor histidine kinase BaeS
VRRFQRLRWQLTLSHLKAIAFTLVSMTVAIVLVATGWIHQQSDPAYAPGRDARAAAELIAPAVAAGAAAQVDEGLAALARLPATTPVGPWGWAPARRWEWAGPLLQDVAYLAVVGPDGRVLGSSDPAGASFAPPERGEWASVVGPALAGERDLGRLSVRRGGPGPVALGAYPVVGPDGRVVAAVVAARTALPSPEWVGGTLFRAFAALGASIVVLIVASLFALASASLVAYLLSRKLVDRLERLGAAAGALAAGDLSRRVDAGGDDEVGQLGRQFNEMANRLAATVGELEAALRTRRELVANVSHELRTPLASIRGHVETLLMRGDRHEYLDLIYRETEHLSRLVDDLFVLSTAEAGGLPLAIEAVPLGEVVEEVAAGVRPAARRERRVTVVTEVAPDLPPARADRQRVAQILGNLARNALRHTPEGGLVSLRAARRADRAVVTVEDTGVGIPPDQLARVWERFYRVDQSRARALGGAGLGLAIVRELAEAMGGTVEAESQVGVGSRFSVSLPLAGTDG